SQGPQRHAAVFHDSGAALAGVLVADNGFGSGFSGISAASTSRESDVASMKYPATIPSNVRRAVAIYVGWRRFVGVATAMLAGVAAAVAISVAFIVIDRYTQWPQSMRNAGPWVAGAALLAGIAAALIALLRRHHPFGVAVRLDCAFPQHQDRWSSSLDL